MQLLLQAGADPTIRNYDGDRALDKARLDGHQLCISLLEAAVAEPQRSRLLFKARALVATRRVVMVATAALVSKGMSTVLHQDIIAMAVPSHLAGRVAQSQELPRVSIQNDNDEQVAACVKYALGLEGGGGVVLKGQEPAVGMLPEVLVELLELLVPKWDPAREGRVLGEGV